MLGYLFLKSLGLFVSHVNDFQKRVFVFFVGAVGLVPVRQNVHAGHTSKSGW